MKKTILSIIVYVAIAFVVSGVVNFLSAPKCEKCGERIHDTKYKAEDKYYHGECKPEGIYIPK